MRIAIRFPAAIVLFFIKPSLVCGIFSAALSLPSYFRAFVETAWFIYIALSGLKRLWGLPFSQGLALGCHISPFQG